MNTMTCPDEGTLRAFLDREDDDHEARAAHIRGCLDCRRQVRDLRADAAFATGLLDDITTQIAPTTATTSALAMAASPTQPAIDPPARKRQWLRVAVAASAVIVAGGLVVTPAGRSLASGLLTAFHSQKVVAVNVTNLDAEQASSVLEQLGTTSQSTEFTEPKQFATVAEAQQVVPFKIAVPEKLPAGLNKTPLVSLVSQRVMTVTFDAAKTKQYLHSYDPNLTVPAGLDQQKLIIDFPDAVGVTYQGQQGDSLVVGTAGSVSVRTDGPMNLQQLRDFLLEVPGMPTSLTNQLGDVDAIGGALPIPVPVDDLNGEETTINGHDAVQISESGLGGGVLWQQDDRLIGVGGTYPIDEITTVAQGLKG